MCHDFIDQRKVNATGAKVLLTCGKLTTVIANLAEFFFKDISFLTIIQFVIHNFLYTL